MTAAAEKSHFWLYFIALVASLGGLLFGYDTGVISGALIYINETWQMSPLEQGWIVSSVIVGAVIGAALNGLLADIYGRKKIIVATALIFALGSLLSACAVSAPWLMVSRGIVGLSVGMVNFIVPLYLSEIAPQKKRGMLVSLFQLAIAGGILFAYLINRVFANVDGNWRWMLGAGMIPALTLLIGISFLGDTPRWLISKNRNREAEDIFKKINPDENAERHLREIRATIDAAAHQKKALQQWMIMPILVGIGMMFIQIATGINTVIFYSASVFQTAGFSDKIGAIYATIGIGAVNFLMTMVAIFFADRWGRKPLLYTGLIGMFLALLALGGGFYLAPQLGDNLKWIAVGSIAVFVASFAMSVGPVGWILISEILPLKIRGLAMSLCTVANFGFNFIVVLSFLPLIHSIGEAWTFWIFAGIAVISILFVYFFVPETKGISLEEIEKNWRNKVPARKF